MLGLGVDDAFIIIEALGRQETVNYLRADGGEGGPEEDSEQALILARTSRISKALGEAGPSIR